MRDRLPLISVIIPSKSAGECQDCLKALQKVNYPLKNIEVFLAFGKIPSKQRNLAAKKSRGEILYFLDNDSEVEPNAFRLVASVFNHKEIPFKNYHPRGFSLLPREISKFIVDRFFSGQIYKGEVGVVGGPNIWRKKENFWSSIAGFTLESFFIHAQMAARYRSIGNIHRASERELILCNMAVRRDVFNQVHGFDEVLYPNEENEFLNRVESAGYQIVYHPGVVVFRPRRQTLYNLLKAFVYYGRGRMEQIKIEGFGQSFFVFAPVALLLYLLGIVASIAVFGFYRFLPILAVPVLLYLLVALFSALGYSRRRKRYYLSLFLPLFFLFIHLTYALGLLYGLGTNIRKKRIKAFRETVKIVKIKGFGERLRI